jgi:peptidoglycan biosynthesis protein MviN/MurJ (putative lipid II flippase)
VIQVLLPLPWLRGLDGRLRVLVDWRDPMVKRFFALMLPVTLSIGLINFNSVIDQLFASRLLDPNIAPTAIDKAFRIYMLPQGMFSIAVATVLFPSLSRLAARNDMDGSSPRSDTGCVRSASCSCRRASPPPCSRSRSCGSSTSAASSRPRRRRSSPARSRPSRPGSSSTGRC